MSRFPPLFLRLPALFLCVCLCGACSVRKAPPCRTVEQDPCQEFQQELPAEDSASADEPALFQEEGTGSWYGPGFHGRRTANGECFNQDALTAAHKYLPMNTCVRVTNLRTRQSVVVRINDRGPFAPNRIIDLSKGAAKAIGLHSAGIGPVRVETLSAVAGARPDGNLEGRFYIQAGAFAKTSNSRRLQEQLQAAGHSVRCVPAKRPGITLVQAGPWKDLSAARQALPGLRQYAPQAYVLRED